METPAEYSKRLRGYVGDRDPLTIMRSTPAELRALVDGRKPEILRAQPAPGKWSVTQILAHLADAEHVVGYRIRVVIGQPGSNIQGFDPDSWAAAMHYDSIPIDRSLQRFTAARESNLALLESLAAGDWEKHGIHSERGRETVRDIVVLDAGHDINHSNQIRGILG